MKLDRQIEVFISSKLGDKYEIVRKALCKLLEETGFFRCFLCEREPACSTTVEESYLPYVETSQIYVLLYDKSVPISEGTLNEYKRAKELKKHIIAIISNESNSTEDTPIEQELKQANICKFVTVPKFADMTEAAYKAVIHDMVNVYYARSYPTTSTTLVSELIVDSIGGEPLVDKHIIDDFSSSKGAIVNYLFNYKNNSENVSEIDSRCQAFMQTVLCNEPFDLDSFNILHRLIIEKHNASYQEIVSLRLEAISLYYLGKMSECVTILEKTLEKAKQATDIPQWLVNDIAIDLRNLQSELDYIEGKYSYTNKGQVELDSNTEFLYCPAIDRLVNNSRAKIIKKSVSRIIESPYTVTIGGDDEAFVNVASAFCMALMYGSITHTTLLRQHLIEILHIYNECYEDKRISDELVRLLFVVDSTKELDGLFRTHNKPFSLINRDNIKSVLESLDTLPLEHKKNAAKLSLLKYCGNYMTDEQFDEMIKWFISFVENWMENSNRIINMQKSIFDVYINCNRRISQEVFAAHVSYLLNSHIPLFLHNGCKLVEYIQVSELSENSQRTLGAALLNLLDGNENDSDQAELKHSIISFRKFATIDMDWFDLEIETKSNAFYNNTYKLEMGGYDHDFLISQIFNRLRQISERIKTQGKKGRIGYGDNPIADISNIIEYKKIQLSTDEIKQLIDTVSIFLLSPNQSAEDKYYAIHLLAIIFITQKQARHFKECLLEILHNKEIYNIDTIIIFDKLSTACLSLCVNVLLSIVDESSICDAVLSLANIMRLSEYDKIYSIYFVARILENISSAKPADELTFSILQTALQLSTSKERDIQYYAVRCLLALLSSKYNEIVLRQLSMEMENGNVTNKSLIVRSVKDLEVDSQWKEFVLQKAKIDGNFIVRKLASN